MRGPLLFVAMAVGICTPAIAQEGPEWDAQRCIWSCLSAFGPATNPAYHACVDRTCAEMIEAVEGPSAQSAQGEAAPQTAWSAGPVADGTGAYAGASTADGTRQFYYACGPGGQGMVVLIGPEGPPATLQLVIDGRAYPLFFDGTEAEHVALVPPGSEALAAMAAGTSLEVLNAGGASLGQFGLAGFADALSRAQALCR